MEKQKKIALINDLTGFGRCSTAVMAPIVSAMKIQAVAVPTAILSAHTQFETYYFDDYTDRMKEYIQTYKDLKIKNNTDAPTVIEFMIATEEIVLPMVPGGNPMNNMILKSK